MTFSTIRDEVARLLRRLHPKHYAFKDRVKKRADYLQRLRPGMSRSMAEYFAECKEHEIDLARETGEIDKYRDTIEAVERQAPDAE